MSQKEPSPMTQIEGVVENITFKSEDNGFVVFKLKPLNESGTVTVVSNIGVPFIGEQLQLAGGWTEHARFGSQFKASSMKRMPLSTVQGIERFLASGAVKGVGPAMAARLVKHFGGRALEVIELTPHRLVEVEGIGTKKAEMIRKSYAELAEMRELMVFFESHGVSNAYAAKVYARYGINAIQVLEENPYRLAAEIDGIGFRTADQIALSMGFEHNHPDRLKAGVDFALLQIAQAGHTCVPEKALVEQTAKLLRADNLEIALIVDDLNKENLLCTEDYHSLTLIYPEFLYRAEQNVAQRLNELQISAAQLARQDYHELVKEWQTHSGIQLAAAQFEAMCSALAHGILVVTGGPGTGKTTTIRGIIDVLETFGLRILLGAPTGRAAKRLAESTGRETMTVHRMLEAGGQAEGMPYFARNEENQLEADVIILDEVSMMDILLMNYFLRAVPAGCRVILVGDVDQLPAVGPGAVLKDIIRSQVLPVVRLTEVFRQAQESMIIQNAHRINRGLNPQFNKASDFQFIECENDEQAARKIILLCQEELLAEGYNPLHDVQILSPMHRLVCGVANLNKMLQNTLNPPEVAKPEMIGPNQLFRVGDKVMQMKNNYEKGVFNGDIGFITDIDVNRLCVRFPDADINYERAELDELNLAYAMSVHKSQGSEYPVVIVPLVAGHYIMLQRNLLYTAVTRAKEKVILIGSKAALNTAVGNDKTRHRYSLLAERLRGEVLC